MNELKTFPHDQAIFEQVERQTYGITVDQVKQCIEWHDGDHLEYVGSIAKLAQTHVSDLDPSPAAEAIRVLINRIVLADTLSQSTGVN